MKYKTDIFPKAGIGNILSLSYQIPVEWRTVLKLLVCQNNAYGGWWRSRNSTTEQLFL